MVLIGSNLISVSIHQTQMLQRPPAFERVKIIMFSVMIIGCYAHVLIHKL